MFIWLRGGGRRTTTPKKNGADYEDGGSFFFLFFYILNTALNLQEVFKELTTRRRALEDEIMSRRIASAAVRSTLKPVTSNRGRLNKTTQPL